MTVSSTISVFCRDGVFRTVYCHLHGEPTWNGRILHTHYATGQQAEALVEHGDIRCLGPRCDKPAGHTLQNPVDGVTAYYGRDSGFRMDSEAREYRSFREAIATESTEEVRFHYVFIDGYWKVMYRTPEGWKMKACVFRSIRSRIGIEVRSAIRIHSINRELNFFYRFLTRFFAAFHYRGIFPQ